MLELFRRSGYLVLVLRWFRSLGLGFRGFTSGSRGCHSDFIAASAGQVVGFGIYGLEIGAGFIVLGQEHRRLR